MGLDMNSGFDLAKYVSDSARASRVSTLVRSRQAVARLAALLLQGR